MFGKGGCNGRGYIHRDSFNRGSSASDTGNIKAYRISQTDKANDREQEKKVWQS